MKKRVTLSVILMILYISVIFFLCLFDFSKTNVELPGYFLGIRIDRYIHFFMFLPFPFICWLLFFMLNFLQKRGLVRNLTIVSIGAALAGFTEFAQSYFTDYRSSDPLDFLADCIGLLAGVIVISLLNKVQHKKRA